MARKKKEIMKRIDLDSIKGGKISADEIAAIKKESLWVFQPGVPVDNSGSNLCGCRNVCYA